MLFIRNIFFFILFTAVLTAQTSTPPSSGDGNSAGTAYQIATLNNLYWLATQVNSGTSYSGKFFVQTGDIDASSSSGWAGGGFVPIGNGSVHFSGTYDGGGYAISGITISRSSSTFQGLFGSTSGATIKNLGVTSVSISGSSQVGGLAGSVGSSSTINSCYSTGSITNSSGEGGGLVGRLISSSSITKSYSSASVSTPSSWSFGGLVGYNESCAISNCYSSGTVSGAGNGVGGLVGNNTGGTITYSYSNSIVSTSGAYNGGLIGGNFGGGSASNSFWNTSKTASSSAGTGKTDTQMKTGSTFYDAGWDFYGVSSGTIWNIGNSRNSGYPYFQWQYPGDTPFPVELISFSAKISNKVIELNWATATEVNNSGFEIQKKDINGDWAVLSFVTGAGTSNSVNNYTFNDASPLKGTNTYRLRQIDNNGEFSFSPVINAEFNTVSEFSLEQNYPNPFNPETVIKFSLPVSENVTLKVYDVIGNEVLSLLNGLQSAGEHSIRVNASGLNSGVYFYRLSGNGINITKKFILSK